MQIFTKFHESTLKNFSKIILRKLKKKANPSAKRKIEKESKQFAKHLGIDDRIKCYSGQHASITLKDHKSNFKNKC